MMKQGPCLIIGANGLIGRSLAKIFSQRGFQWLGTYCYRFEPGLLELNVFDFEKIKNIFSKFKPNAVIFCANFPGGVDGCEREPQKASQFHWEAVCEIVKQCQRHKTFFVFLSTDYVFNGKKEFYDEKTIPVGPLNRYGKLKLQAEQEIQKNLKSFLIIRTTNVYGWDPKTVTPNYVMSLYQAIKQKKHFYAPSFLTASPTYVQDLTKALVELYTRKAKGIFHIVGESTVNRFEWALQACRILDWDSQWVREMKTPPLHFVPRPFHSLLRNKKFKDSHLTPLHSLEEGLELMKKEMRLF